MKNLINKILIVLLALLFSQNSSAQGSQKMYAWGSQEYGQLGNGKFRDYTSPQKIGKSSNWSTFSAGKNFVLAINTRGELFGWGLNEEGTLGINNTSDCDTPIRVGNSSNWSLVSAGGRHSLALNSNGEIFGWGQDWAGQLAGNGFTTVPVQIGILNDWVSIAAGENHSIAINSNGELFAWGDNSMGQLGVGNNTNYNSPQRVGNANDWVKIYAEGNHTFAINSNQELFAWGDNGNGQLGTGGTNNVDTPLLKSGNWVNIATSGSHTLAIDDNGYLYSWGSNGSGQLGNGTIISQYSAILVDNSMNWIDISCGNAMSCAVNVNGEIYSWGLGVRSLQKLSTSYTWASINSGIDLPFSIAINSNKELFSWGNNYFGQLGIGSFVYRPEQIGESRIWKKIICGTDHSLAISSDNELCAWGANSSGQLGNSNTENQSNIVKISNANNWLNIAAGHNHSIAINSNGEIFSFGNNGFGQLGQGDKISRSVLIKIGNSSNWTFITSGSRHTIAINADGELFSWGSNGDGQLGIGNTTNQTSPQKVGSANNWISAAAGEHSIAINTDGELFSWGSNWAGQLGIGNTTNQTSPQKVGSANNWISLAAGWYHTLAINSNGELYSWGYNFYGQLGLGNTTNQKIPQKIGTKSDWIAVATGDYNSFAINKKGELYAWGENSLGQLGIGNTANQTIPIRVDSSLMWKNISAGQFHSIGLVSMNFRWSGVNNINSARNWSDAQVPSSIDSAIILSGTMNVNQATTLDAMKVNNGATVKLTAPLTVRNLHLNNGTIDLNGQRLTITGGIYQSTDSTNYYIQAGTSASPKPNSELVFAPTANTSSTLYFNPNANTLKVLELGTSSKTTQVTLGNSVNIKGGKKPSNVGSLKVNNGSKLIIPTGTSLTLQSDTFNAYLDLAAPAQRAIHCSGTGTFNIERQHYGARGWRLYSHPFSADINLTQIADDIELIGSGGTSEGFYSDAHTSNAAFWYDYSKADTTATTDLAWTGFSSAKGTLISGNANKWKKNSPIIVFNPGAVRGSGAFSNPTSATYQEGKITLSYTLDSTAVHLNDGKTQTITTADLTSAPKSRYFFLTNPFTAPIRLSRIQGLNLTNCANKFYYWKQNQASISSNFMPAAWASEALFNGNATRDSNICIPAFGTILIEMRNPSTATTFTIPESAKQLTNFNYMVGGDLSSSGSGVKQTLFMELPQPYQGPGAIEVQLLMNDSVPVDRMLIYDRSGESTSFTNNDAKKFKEPSFSNIYSFCRSGELLSLDAQDITARLASGEEQVEIPLVIDRDFNKTQKNLRLRIGEKHSDLECYFKDAKTGILTTAESLSDLPLEFLESEVSIHRYSLVFKRNSSSTEDIQKETYVTESQLLAYPNPVEDQLHIRLLNHNGKVPYRIYSIEGKKVLDGTIQNLEIINTKQLQAGIYIIEANGEKVKFVKE